MDATPLDLRCSMLNPTRTTTVPMPSQAPAQPVDTEHSPPKSALLDVDFADEACVRSLAFPSSSPASSPSRPHSPRPPPLQPPGSVCPSARGAGPDARLSATVAVGRALAGVGGAVAAAARRRPEALIRLGLCSHSLKGQAVRTSSPSFPVPLESASAHPPPSPDAASPRPPGRRAGPITFVSLSAPPDSTRRSHSLCLEF